MKKKPTSIELRDTALALIFVCFLVWVFTRSAYPVYLGMGLTLTAMIYPRSMKYPAIFWFGLAHLLNQVVSKIILGAAYFLLVVPMAMIRRLMGKDPMGLKKWRDGRESAFVERDHHFSKDDLFRQF